MILNCRDCWDKFGFEPNPIFQGKVFSPVFQVSQAPSQKVHETGKPFNDTSGKRLIEEWYQVSKEVFYNSSYFYITALSHCYPGKTSSGNDKLPPKYCTNKWLLKELKAVNNKIYIIIGAKSANYFFPGEQFNRLVFNDQQINNKPAFVIPHPSPLNNRWFKKNPAFFDGRIQQIRKQLWKAIE